MDCSLDLYGDLFYHRFDIRIAATQDTVFDAWAGAVIRNNLLYAAEQVLVEGNLSLRDKISQIPLPEAHPLYKELASGFPKGYVIALPDSCPMEAPIKKDDLFCFSLYLIGDLSVYFPAFIKAIRLMCNKGMGHPVVPFIPVDICERDLGRELHLLCMGGDDLSDKLIFPVSFADIHYISVRARDTLSITFTTPTILFKQVNKKNKTLSYQDKSNGYPSFYQLVRSIAYRMLKLNVLYIHPNDIELAKTLMENIEEWIDYATNLSLISADIQKITFNNTPKKESENKMPLSGYVGTQQYEGSFSRFLSALKFMEALGVGNEVVYGMGRYKIDIEKWII